LLKEKELEREKQNKFLDIIVSRSKNLLQIINDIIDISKIEANQLKIENQEFSLKKTFYEIHTFFEAELYTLGKTDLKFEFNSEFNEYTSIIKSDEVRLKQIITNLISNSIKFTSKGKIEFGYSLKGNNLEFFVRDTGVGIPKEAQKYVFERFRQADDSSTREFGGTGLGLAICMQLVEKLGGKIWFTSEVNKGSVFYFTIPFQPTKTMTVENETKALGLIDLTGKKVLLVEDDLISMTYLEELLAGTNATIIKATDGNIAVSKFKENLDIDIILMDVYLPTMSGNEATREIKTINPNVPVIMQSAYAMPSDKKESFKYGCDDYVTKPIDNRVLMYTIKKHLK
jgi:CheY-like chemotaxis protein/anti-sigma regulatory factor (Ser/Thr protein kinase)